jgi:hypothetical protein
MKRVVSYNYMFLIVSDNSSHCKKPYFCPTNLQNIYMNTLYVKFNDSEVQIYVNVFIMLYATGSVFIEALYWTLSIV